ncbi:2-amino-3,7-dideoxy-D-threo-hept-6-ulosonate synthase [Candidatus Halobonum tyrrellensis]|uniref:2-amino-3,7-dideoxy-D-threo-hept-6-ulosonate synthase n=1 Tax=Candidatus Halobonum tyrrellensis G22 TaxID=1324957 RepID=V4IYW9_9EURY|nr:2-amino-3,7-dideoxy-D-threo-hept-6-ulosonate synthase [Candidatus Halobonum tyrrellensis]ESP88307.1 fructose-bisphosphate aldolase [Candidatus Halobonum tyrrellensis G22]
MEHAGLDARLDRISTDGRVLMVPMDHGITLGAVDGLRDIESTIDAVTRGGADAVLTQKGIAPRVHPNKNDAGYLVHLNASTVVGPEANDKRRTGTVKAAIRAGADAVSVHVNVGSDYEPEQVEFLTDVTETASDYGLPTLAMAYARGANLEGDDPEHDPEYLGHAVRLAEECGADLVKTAYSGDADSFESVVGSTRLPVIIAGGSPVGDEATLDAVRGAMDAGAAGVSMGRTIFQHRDPGAMTRAVSAVVHDDAPAADALAESGLGEEAE